MARVSVTVVAAGEAVAFGEGAGGAFFIGAGEVANAVLQMRAARQEVSSNLFFMIGFLIKCLLPSPAR